MDDIIVVDRNAVLRLINSVRQFCNITEIKGFDSMNIILGVEIGLENMLKSSDSINALKEAEETHPKTAPKLDQDGIDID